MTVARERSVGSAAVAVAVEERPSAVDTQEAEGFLIQLTGDLPWGIVVVDVMGRILHANDLWRRAMGGSQQLEYHHTLWEMLGSEEDEARLRQGLMRLLNGADERFDAVARFRTAGASSKRLASIWRLWKGADGTPGGFVGCLYPGGVRARSSERLAPVARSVGLEVVSVDRAEVPLGPRDPLTGLINRHSFIPLVEEAAHRAMLGNHSVGLLLIGLDDFSLLNDSLGYDAGDLIIRTMAGRLARLLETQPYDDSERHNAQLARLSGDEFAIVLEGASPSDSILALARATMCTLEEPIFVADRSVYLCASAGVATLPGTTDEPGLLLRHADLALRRAKRDGKRQVCSYEPAVDSHALKQHAFAAELRGALLRREVTLAYQPQIDLRSGQVCGAEALMRWTNREFGAVSPADFIPVAERTGDIHALGSWALREACRQVRAWREAGLPSVVVSVNLSAAQFREENLLEVVESALRGENVSPEALELEITESVFLRDIDRARTKLEALRALGITIALDDFGTGFSSLNYLTHLPVDKLKLDRSFIRDIVTDKRQESIVRSVVSLSHNIGIRVNVEGVETAEQLAAVHAAGADEVQGFFFSPALVPDQLASQLCGQHLAHAACARCPRQPHDHAEGCPLRDD